MKVHDDIVTAGLFPCLMLRKSERNRKIPEANKDFIDEVVESSTEIWSFS